MREPITKANILREALRLADSGGVASLSMRKIAAVLGVKAMSLYNHVSNKEEILDGLVELVVSEIELPRLDDPWKPAMRRRADSAHAMLLSHPWAVLALLNRRTAGPKMLTYVDATLGCLRQAGFSPILADRIWNTMDNHIYGYTLREVNFPFQAPEYAETSREFLARIPAERYPHFTELAALIMEGGYSGVHDFHFGLNLILDGVEAYRNAV